MYTSLIALILSILAGLFPSQVVETEAPAPAPVTEVVSTEVVSWEQSVLDNAGLTLPANTRLFFTEDQNCGSKLSPTGTGGGCTFLTVEDYTAVIVSPQVYGTPEGAHILLHEVAHANGIMDECAAEYFAHDHGSDWELWSYPQCMTEDD